MSSRNESLRDRAALAVLTAANRGVADAVEAANAADSSSRIRQFDCAGRQKVASSPGFSV